MSVRGQKGKSPRTEDLSAAGRRCRCRQRSLALGACVRAASGVVNHGDGLPAITGRCRHRQRRQPFAEATITAVSDSQPGAFANSGILLRIMVFASGLMTCFSPQITDTTVSF